MKILIQTKWVEFYLCLGKVFDAQIDDFARKGFTVRIRQFVYNFVTGWRKL